jgi:hypothetical protein
MNEGDHMGTASAATLERAATIRRILQTLYEFRLASKSVASFAVRQIGLTGFL